MLPLIIYIILAFKDINPVLNVVICVVLSAIMTKQPFSSMGEVLGSALGSFLGIIGFIIMLGSALGAVLKETGAAEFLIMTLMKKIGINSEKKAILASMVTSIVIVALLGSLAGANAIIAPMIIPLVAIIGITPSTMAAVLMGAGITGPFHRAVLSAGGDDYVPDRNDLFPVHYPDRTSRSGSLLGDYLYLRFQNSEKDKGCLPV